MQRVHFQVRFGVFNCQQILAKISFVIFDNVIKKKQTNKQIECGLAWHWWNSTDLGLIDMFVINLNAEIVACILSFRKLRHKPNLESTSKYGFSPDLRGKNGGVLSMRMQVILDSSFARPGSDPIWGGKKGETASSAIWALREIADQCAPFISYKHKSDSKMLYSSVHLSVSYLGKTK